MKVADKLYLSNLVVDVVVAAVVELLLLLLLLLSFGYRWGQIVNLHDVHYVVQDSCGRDKLAKESLNLKRPEAFRKAKIELVPNVG